MNKLLVFLFALTFISCKNDVEKQRIQNLLSTFDIEEQVFVISPTNSTTVKGKKGTIITVNPSNLKFENGEEIKGKITLALKELTTKEELLRANAQTISNGKWLVSGGAYQINLFANGKKLKLKEGKSITVEFPMLTDEKMSLFQGDRDSNGNMNWNEINDIVLQEKKYPTIFYKDSSFIAFNRILALDYPDYITLNKRLGNFTVNDLKKKLLQLDSIGIRNDTLYAYQYDSSRFYEKFNFSEEDLSVEFIDSINRIYNEEVVDFLVNNIFYRKVSLLKLGWINIDHFYSEVREKVKIKLNTNEVIRMQSVFVFDIEENTVLNWSSGIDDEYQLEFPKDKRFQLIAFGVKNKDIFAVKKNFRTNKPKKISLSPKKILENEVESYFKIN